MTSTSLQGFGSADVTTPFNYGSVADGITHHPSLEQKLKKKYWKTKQTVIQKLNKSQDKFVVAGDADIDTKLEVRWNPSNTCLRGRCSPDMGTQAFITTFASSCAGSLPSAVILSSVAADSGEILLQTER